MRRQGTMPFVFALALTVAAGLALAAERIRPAATGAAHPAASSEAGSTGLAQRPLAPNAGAVSKITQDRAPSGAGLKAEAASAGGGSEAKYGVGSRALIGNDAADQPGTATGTDLEAMPTRFPTIDTPE